MPLVKCFLCYVASLCLSRFLYSHLTILPHAETMPTSGQPSPPFDLTVQPESLHNDRPQSKPDIVKIRVHGPSKARQRLCSLTSSSSDHLCTVCSRQFQTQKALESHWTHSKRHNWCLKCNRHFVSGAALDEHLQKSQRRWICDNHRLKTSFSSTIARFTVSATVKGYRKAWLRDIYTSRTAQKSLCPTCILIASQKLRMF